MAKDDLTLRIPKGSPLTHNQQDDNFNRLSYPSGLWLPGTYTPNELVHHRGGLWHCLNQTTDEPNEFSTDWVLYAPIPGLGEVNLFAPVAGSDIGAAYLPLNDWNTVTVPGIGITFNATLGEFSFGWPGTWQLSLSLIWEHNSSNTGRLTNVRYHNVTEGVTSTPVVVATGRNAEATAITLLLLVNIGVTDIGDVFRYEIGGGDAYTSVVWDQQALAFVQLTPRHV